MSQVPSYQVYGRNKIQKNPKPRIRKRLQVRTFQESELEQLDEVLDANNIDIQGNFNKQYLFVRDIVYWLYYICISREQNQY